MVEGARVGRHLEAQLERLGLVDRRQVAGDRRVDQDVVVELELALMVVRLKVALGLQIVVCADVESERQLGLQVGRKLIPTVGDQIAVVVRSLGGEEREELAVVRQHCVFNVSTERSHLGGRGSWVEDTYAESGQLWRGSLEHAEDLERQRALLHRAGHRTNVVHRVDHRVATIVGDETPRALVARDLTGSRGNSNRATGIRTECDCGEPTSQCGRGTTRRAAGNFAWVPRVLGIAVVGVLRRDAPGELT